MPGAFYQERVIAVTGASSGLGAEFARQLAPRARKLLLIARREEALRSLADELRARNPTLEVGVIPADLSDAATLEVLAERMVREAPDILINNAGLGDYGAFSRADSRKNQTLVAVNIGALTRLSHAVLSREPAPTGILHVSSLAASLPIPDFAVYAASKAYVTSFSETLRLENADRGVHITAMCPGPIPTEFGQTARRSPDSDLGVAPRNLIAVSAPFAVSKALAGLANNRARVFPGLRVRLAAFFFEIMPRPILRWVLARMPRSH